MAAGPRDDAIARAVASVPVTPSHGDLDAGARDLFGRGGRLFVTTASGGAGWISTLVQADGDIVTRGTPDCVTDADLLARHNQAITVWLSALAREWRSVQRWADGAATGAAVVTVGGGSALAATNHSALSVAAFAAFIAVGTVRAAGATLLRRRFLRSGTH